jgi:hypothetical protein
MGVPSVVSAALVSRQTRVFPREDIGLLSTNTQVPVAQWNSQGKRHIVNFYLPASASS